MNDNRKQLAQIAPQSLHLPPAIIKLDQAPGLMFNSMCKCSSYCANVQRWCAIIRAYQVQAPILNVKHKFSSWEIFARIISKVAAWPQTWLCWKMILHEKPDNQYPHCLMSFIGKSARQHLSDSLLSTQRQMSVRTHFHIMEIHANTIKWKCTFNAEQIHNSYKVNTYFYGFHLYQCVQCPLLWWCMVRQEGHPRESLISKSHI